MLLSSLPEKGGRLGGGLPKAFAPIAGRPLVLRTLERMFCSADDRRATLVVAAAELERCEALSQDGRPGPAGSAVPFTGGRGDAPAVGQARFGKGAAKAISF